MNSRELPKERPATMDEKGRRVWLYVADVRGRFRRLRTQMQWVLILFFLILPWLRWNGNPLILLDVVHRKFSLLGTVFWAHEAPLLFFILIGAVMAIALATVLLGRVWCGYACPQTVFTDAIFRRIERWIEGDAIARKKLDQGPWNFDRLFKRSLKWGIFTLAATCIGHSFLAYFVGTDELLLMIRHSPAEHPESFLVMAFTTGVTLFDFGWFREQFCTIMCPYGRFQSVLMDDHSWAVVYDTQRGEPRKGTVLEAEQKLGDCVNCFRCVQVCPTGIDIRRGLQLECVACTSCIDACDEIMQKVGKPQGLIRYDTLAGVLGQPKKQIRLRAVLYGGILLLSILVLTYLLILRQPLSVTLIRAIENPYQVVPPEVINHFKVELANQTGNDLKVEIKMPPEISSLIKVVTTTPTLSLKSSEGKRIDIFLKFPQSLLNSGHLETQILFATPEFKIQKEIKLIGPLR